MPEIQIQSPISPLLLTGAHPCPSLVNPNNKHSRRRSNSIPTSFIGGGGSNNNYSGNAGGVIKRSLNFITSGTHSGGLGSPSGGVTVTGTGSESGSNSSSSSLGGVKHHRNKFNHKSIGNPKQKRERRASLTVTATRIRTTTTARDLQDSSPVVVVNQHHHHNTNNNNKKTSCIGTCLQPRFSVQSHLISPASLDPFSSSTSSSSSSSHFSFSSSFPSTSSASSTDFSTSAASPTTASSSSEVSPLACPSFSSPGHFCELKGKELSEGLGLELGDQQQQQQRKPHQNQINCGGVGGSSPVSHLGNINKNKNQEKLNSNNLFFNPRPSLTQQSRTSSSSSSSSSSTSSYSSSSCSSSSISSHFYFTSSSFRNEPEHLQAVPRGVFPVVKDPKESEQQNSESFPWSSSSSSDNKTPQIISKTKQNNIFSVSLFPEQSNKAPKSKSLTSSNHLMSDNPLAQKKSSTNPNPKPTERISTITSTTSNTTSNTTSTITTTAAVTAKMTAKTAQPPSMLLMSASSIDEAFSAPASLETSQLTDLMMVQQQCGGQLQKLHQQHQSACSIPRSLPLTIPISNGDETGPEVDAISSASSTTSVDSYGFSIPFNFAMVWPGVYRCSFPKREHFEYLKGLKLKTILTLVPEEYPEENVVFMKENGIKHYQIGMQGNKKPLAKIPLEKINEAVRVVLDRANHPILIHCNKGKHRTGCVVGCVRKMQYWEVESVVEEYRHYSVPKNRIMDEQLLESWDGSELEEFAEAQGGWSDVGGSLEK